jgi:competence protein ComEC
MSVPTAVPESRLGPEGGLEAACAPGDLLYFLLNVGDGDTQLLLLPEDPAGRRRAIVVDVAGASKLSSFLDHLATSALLPETDRLFSLVVATHPHEDHIGGMATFLDRFHSLVDEVWEPGYYHTTNSYAEMMRAIEDYDVRHTQPTSGLCRFIGNLQITVLAPGIGLRGRFDSYGVGINNASIALKLDFPASRVIQRRQDRTYVKLPSSKSLILGADAQTLSWSQALVDFPQLGPQRTAVSQALRAARGTVPLRADVFKVPHHGSKHGVNLELVEAISPTLCLISSVAGGGEYNFPHSVAQEAIREGLEALAGKASGKRSPDHELGLHYTCEQSETGKALGTIGVVLTPGGKRRVWRFMDRASDRIDLARSRELI